VAELQERALDTLGGSHRGKEFSESLIEYEEDTARGERRLRRQLAGKYRVVSL